MPDEALCRLHAREIVYGLRARQFSCVDVTAACLARIEQLNGRFKAFLTVAADGVLAAAERADRAIARGTQLKSLHGVPIAFKDLVATRGIRTTYGSTLFADHVPRTDDAVVTRLRRAGAIIIGKTNTPEFGYGAITDNKLLGPTANPYDPRMTSGGSSGGSAVAVSLGMLPLAHGTDFAGSVRVPASFCGIVGVRPTIGRIAVSSKMPLWQNLIGDGIFARNVEDAAFALSSMYGRDDRDPVSQMNGRSRPLHFSPEPNRRLRIGVSLDLGFAVVDHGVEHVFWEAVGRLATVFPRTERVTPDLSGTQECFEILRGALLHDQFAALVAEHGDRLSETLRFNVGLGEGLSAAKYMRAERARSDIYLRMLRYFDDHDILVTVSAAVPPFPNADGNVYQINGQKLRHMIDWFAVESLATVTGLPTMSIPCGWTPRGLPIGLQLIAKPFAESTMLQCAFWLQEELGFRHHWPDY